MAGISPYFPILNDGINVMLPDIIPTPAPKITAVSPSAGPLSGGNSVTITGTGFMGATVVEFDGTDAEEFTVVSDIEIEAEVPEHTAGTIGVKVVTPAGMDQLDQSYSYRANAAFGTISPDEGPAGTEVTLTFTGTFEADLPLYQVIFDQEIIGHSDFESATFSGGTMTVKVLAPAHANGAVDVSLRGPGGDATREDAFTYTTAPPPSGD